MIPHFESVEGQITFSMVLVTSRTCLHFQSFSCLDAPAAFNEENQFFCAKNEDFKCELVPAEVINSDYVVSEISDSSYLELSMIVSSLFSPSVLIASVEFESSLLPRKEK